MLSLTQAAKRLGVEKSALYYHGYLRGRLPFSVGADGRLKFDAEAVERAAEAVRARGIRAALTTPNAPEGA